MKPAPTPSNETERLAALERYEILDTEADELFDSIVKLAATICDVPIALISLIDPERQWFKAKVGIDASETPRDLAFCAHAILDPKNLLIVPDATKDARFARNPLVTGAPDIRFYAGAPLLTSDDYALGTLCVIDRKPRQLSDRQIDALKALSQQVCANLDLRLKSRKLEELNESKNRLFSLLSHDIRSPLLSMISIVDLINSEDMGVTGAERTEYLNHLKDSAGATLQIAENLLRSAQFEQGRFSFEPARIPLADVVASAEFMLSGTLATKKIRFRRDFPDNAEIWADRAMVQSILQNLLSNAFKFTRENGAVSVAARRHAGTWTITVADNGIGMRPQTLASLFQNSGFSTSGTQGERGSGLGLSLCMQFALKHGGDLVLESEYNVGTTATLTLPDGAMS